MARNRVVYNGETLIDLCNDSVTPETLLAGHTAHDKSGNVISGAISTVEQATPTVTFYTNGKIEAKCTQETGYVTGGTLTATKQMTTQAAKTVTPTTSDQTAVAQYRFTTGAVTVKGDANLIPDNIKSGVSIFKVLGTFEGGADIKTCELSMLSDFSNINYVCPVLNEDGSIGFSTGTLGPSAWVTVPNAISGSFAVVTGSAYLGAPLGADDLSNATLYASIYAGRLYKFDNANSSITVRICIKSAY